jgi:hypothetical protein
MLQVRGITTDGEKRGIKWDRWKIRVSGRVCGTTEKNDESDRYHGDQGKKGNPMG